jgi:hypothetical protein
VPAIKKKPWVAWCEASSKIGKESPVADETPKKLTLDEALALMDKHTEEDAVAAAEKEKKKIKKKEEVKDLIKEGAKQGRGGLGIGTSRQLKALEEDGY